MTSQDFMTYGRPGGRPQTLHLILGVEAPPENIEAEAEKTVSWMRVNFNQVLWEEMKRLIVAECVEPVLEEVSR